ncbi:hypothetical protein CEXT_72901, partial [Caerostris extrusa]
MSVACRQATVHTLTGMDGHTCTCAWGPSNYLAFIRPCSKVGRPLAVAVP